MRTQRALSDAIFSQLSGFMAAQLGVHFPRERWSAGCSSGEGPYSIAMLLERLIPDQAQWITTILATDINPRSLRKAAEAKLDPGITFYFTLERWRSEHDQVERARVDMNIRPRVLFANRCKGRGSRPVPLGAAKQVQGMKRPNASREPEVGTV